jgi:F-type H+-transporting ATPase subunit b
MVSVDFTLVVQWVNFAVLVLILYLILFKPLVKFIDERNAKLKDDIETAEKNKAASEGLHSEYQTKLAELRNEAVKHVEDAKRKAGEERDIILKEAQVEAGRIMEGNRKEVQFEAEKVKQELKQELSSLVINCTSQVLEREVKEGDHKKLIGAFLEEESKNG